MGRQTIVKGISWILIFLGGGATIASSLVSASGDPVGDGFWASSNVHVHFFWNLKARRDGKYKDDWPTERLAAVDTFLFGMRQAFLDMNISEHIITEHDDRVWISMNNTVTNYPDQYHDKQIYDYPPHVNLHLAWREPYWNDTNAHFYTDDTGQILRSRYNYSIGDCPSGDRDIEPGVWMPKVDSQCQVVYEERYTEAGEIQFRIDADSPLYTLRNNGVSDLDVLRDDEVIYNVKRQFHDASIAKMVLAIKDYQRGKLITETIVADPDSGVFTSHTVEEENLADDTPPDQEKLPILFLPWLNR